MCRRERRSAMAVWRLSQALPARRGPWARPCVRIAFPSWCPATGSWPPMAPEATAEGWTSSRRSWIWKHLCSLECRPQSDPRAEVVECHAGGVGRQSTRQGPAEFRKGVIRAHVSEPLVRQMDPPVCHFVQGHEHLEFALGQSCRFGGGPDYSAFTCVLGLDLLQMFVQELAESRVQVLVSGMVSTDSRQEGFDDLQSWLLTEQS